MDNLVLSFLSFIVLKLLHLETILESWISGLGFYHGRITVWNLKTSLYIFSKLNYAKIKEDIINNIAFTDTKLFGCCSITNLFSNLDSLQLEFVTEAHPDSYLKEPLL